MNSPKMVLLVQETVRLEFILPVADASLSSFLGFLRLAALSRFNSVTYANERKERGGHNNNSCRDFLGGKGSISEI